MLAVIKGFVLFGSILLIMPMIFFMFLWMLGGSFMLTLDRNSWLANTNIRWLRRLVHRFLL